MANLKSDLQLAIVGCGRIVENNHLPALAKISNASLVWVVDSDVERARAIGRRVGAGWSKDVIQIPDSIDAALVAVPNHLHVHLCEELLERGIHVLCEKPMAIASVECAGIVKTVERTQKLFAVVHQLRLLPSVLELKSILDEGRMEDITRVDISLGWEFAWPSKTSFYSKQELAGGGAVMDLGCHLLDLAFWLFGDIRYAEMGALYARGMGRRMDTAATIHLEFESGVRGNIRVSHLGLLDNSITVEGSKGFVRASLVDPYVTLNLVDGALFPQGYGAKLAAKGQEPFAELWSRFIACARQGALNGGLCGALEGGRVIQIIDELYENGACPES